MPDDVDIQNAPTATNNGGTGGSGGNVVFTADQVEKFRADERNKLQAKLDKERAERERIQAELDEAKAAQIARIEAEAKAQIEAEAQRQAELEADMDAKTLIAKRDAEFAKKQAEWDAKFAQLQRDAEQREHLFRLEQQHLELKAYIRGRVAEEAQNIHPAFHDYIDGTTADEVEASIALARAKTDAMAQEIAEREGRSTQHALQTGQGVSTFTGPSTVGAVSDIQGDVDWSKVSPREYARLREQGKLPVNINDRGEGILDNTALPTQAQAQLNAGRVF